MRSAPPGSPPYPHPGSGPVAVVPAGPPPQAPWQPPTETEAALHLAKNRNDWHAYLAVLGNTWLYHDAVRLVAETNPGVRMFRDQRTGGWCAPVWTSGLLPPPVADPVFVRRSLRQLAGLRWGAGVCLAVNPGTPCEGYLPVDPQNLALWVRHADAGDPNHTRGTVQTLRVGGATEGAVAHGLACGALLCVSNGSLWNAMGWHGTGYARERGRLRDWWGIETRDEWQSAQEQLLRGQMSSNAWEFVLRVRRALSRAYGGGPVDATRWRQSVEATLRGNNDDVPETELSADVRGLHRLVGRITRYEARFRADGLLPADGYVTSVLAWDYGRASKMARWGLGARFCDLAEAEAAVVRTSEVSRVSYTSWEQFSAGYVLGRCLHFDEEEFGDWYTEMLDAHRALTTTPDSPWLTVPWRERGEGTGAVGL